MKMSRYGEKTCGRSMGAKGRAGISIKKTKKFQYLVHRLGMNNRLYAASAKLSFIPEMKSRAAQRGYAPMEPSSFPLIPAPGRPTSFAVSWITSITKQMGCGALFVAWPLFYIPPALMLLMRRGMLGGVMPP